MKIDMRNRALILAAMLFLITWVLGSCNSHKVYCPDTGSDAAAFNPPADGAVVKSSLAKRDKNGHLKKNKTKRKS